MNATDRNVMNAAWDARLQTYANAKGRNWKREIGNDWYRCAGDMIDIRNHPAGFAYIDASKIVPTVPLRRDGSPK